MKKHLKFVATLVLSLSFVFVQCSGVHWLSSKEKADEKLREQIRALLDDPALANAHIGVYIESLNNGHVVFAQNPYKILLPASNMKLFTTAAALVNLGAEFRYQTKIFAIGPVTDSTLNGDLVVKGSGDPSISGRFYGGNPLAVFNQWADSLKSHGIFKISGNLIGDNSFFKEPVLGEGWNWDDESYWYAAQTSALALNDNCVDFAIWADSSVGRHVSFKFEPKYGEIRVVNHAVIADSLQDSTFHIERLQGKNVIVLSGFLPAHSDTIYESISVEKPGRYFLRSLKRVLQEKGIQIEGMTILRNDSLDYAQARALFTHYSHPLKELIKVVNKPSHNFYAEQILKTMGGLFKQQGSFSGGCQFVREWLQSIGVPAQYFINVDGSGLSRKNFVAPLATATLLRYMYHHPYFKYYYDSLPIAGVDGTLGKRMRGTSAQGNVHAKTGYMAHMRALSGYVNIGKANPMLFVMMFNNYSVPTPYINLIQDRICILLSGE